jgi:hypothetical protein
METSFDDLHYYVYIICYLFIHNNRYLLIYNQKNNIFFKEEFKKLIEMNEKKLFIL